MRRRVLVSGGSGFIGTNLVAHHLSNGDEVWNFDKEAPRRDEHRSVWRRVDLCDGEALSNAIGDVRPHVVYHMGARTDLSGANVAAYAANVQGVANLVRALRGARDLRVAIFASSMLVCRIGYRPKHDTDYCPNTPYGESKVLGEKLVRDGPLDFPWVIVRPTSIWGPWFGSPYRDFFDVVRRGLYVHPSGSRVIRSYGYVGNAVYQLARVAEADGGVLRGKTVYLADHQPIEIKAWAQLIADQFEARAIRELPMPLFRLAAKIGDGLKALGFQTPPMTTFRLTNMLSEMVHDTTPMAEFCGALPFTVEQGVRETCAWMRRST